MCQLTRSYLVKPFLFYFFKSFIGADAAYKRFDNGYTVFIGVSERGDNVTVFHDVYIIFNGKLKVFSGGRF